MTGISFGYNSGENCTMQATSIPMTRLLSYGREILRSRTSAGLYYLSKSSTNHQKLNMRYFPLVNCRDRNQYEQILVLV